MQGDGALQWVSRAAHISAQTNNDSGCLGTRSVVQTLPRATPRSWTMPTGTSSSTRLGGRYDDCPSAGVARSPLFV
jgi:hypothetical protein